MGRDHLGDIGVDGWTDHQEVRWGDVNWIALAQDINGWLALVNAVINPPVP
jgi:hypothetical protein